jgi:peptidoglycan hydrolase CwlO-like protein
MSADPVASETPPLSSTGCPRLACSTTLPQDAAMEHRLTRLEATTQHIQLDLRGLRTEVGEFKGEMRAFKSEMLGFKSEMLGFKSEMRDFQQEVRSEFRDVRHQARTDFRLLFGALIGVALGMAALMAKGFHWI